MTERIELLVVYHSRTGGTDRLMEAAIDAAREHTGSTVDVRPLDALEADADNVLTAAAYLFGTPENFGYMSGALKYFFDRIYYDCLDKVNGRPYGLIVKAGEDGSGAIASVERLVTGLRLKAVAEPVLVVGDIDERGVAAAATLGATLAAGLEAGIY